MPSKKDFRYFKPCTYCDGEIGARSEKELEKKQFCSCKCAASVRKTNKTHRELMVRQIERQYAMMNGNPEKYIKHLLRKPERKHLEVEQLLILLEKQNGKCALSGVDLTFVKIPGQPKVHSNLSIDRIDSSKGYEIDNIQLVAAIVNIMKSTLSNNELVGWCSAIVDNSKEVHHA